MKNEELLALIGRSRKKPNSTRPMPEGYRRGHHKYVVVVGTVMSGLGKGIFSSSLAKLLARQRPEASLRSRWKGYYNIDSGTLNPYRHERSVCA